MLLMLAAITFIAGFVLLIKGADFLVKGSTSLAKRLGVPSLVIGLTVVSFGTSLPELFVNTFASFRGNSDMVLGNIIGSNLANVLLILGLSAFLCSIRVRHSTVWKEIPFSFLAAALLFVMALSGGISMLDGIIMLLFFAGFLFYVFNMFKKERNLADRNLEIAEHGNVAIAVFIAAGILGLYLGGEWVVDGAVLIARSIGMSDFMISATIIALGTSLPELVTNIVAAFRKDVDLAVGNIVGSNIFNIFFILGVSAVIGPIAAGALYDMLFLVFISAMLFAVMFLGKKHTLTRVEGTLFVALYVAYIVFVAARG
jgi:cation:H+ antiporter